MDKHLSKNYIDRVPSLYKSNFLCRCKISYKKHDDIYVSNISFSTNVLLSILDVFLDQKIIVLIESDEDKVQTLSKIGKSLEMTVAVALILLVVKKLPGICMDLHRT